MKVHANAKLTPQGRLTMVRRLENENWSLARAGNRRSPRLPSSRGLPRRLLPMERPAALKDWASPHLAGQGDH